MSMRIVGLASGMDIDQIVNDLMEVERIRLDSVYQDKTRTEWKRDEYRSINLKLRTLRDAAFNMQLQSTYLTHKAVSSNGNAISVSAKGAAAPGEYRIQVNQLAQGAVWAADYKGDGKIDVEKNFAAFKEAYFADESSEEYTFKVSANGEDFIEITITEDTKLSDVLTKIRAGINVFHDQEGTGQVVFSTQDLGAKAKIVFWQGETIPGDDENFEEIDFVKEVFLKTDNGEYASVDAAKNSGKDAELVINGLVTSRSSNTFELGGVTVTLKEETEAPVTITVSHDIDGVVKRITDFVDLYNETIAEINGKLMEPYYRDFPPLTDKQKEAMSEREIELWEEKAKSGMLRNDTMLSGILSEMRLALGSAVAGIEGEYNSLHTIGITTGLWHERGNLHVNETKLREALAKDPESVMALFGQKSESGETSELGLARRLHEGLGASIDRIAERAGSSASLYDQSFLGEQIRRYDERIETLEERLTRTEERYWRQFSAMERALQELYAQSDWLYQQLMALQM